MRNISLRINKEDFKNKLGIKDGIDGKTPTKKELISIIKPLIPEPKKEVIIEKTETIIEKPVVNNIENPVSGQEIVDKINELPIYKEFQIDAKHIKGLKDSVQVIQRGGNALRDIITDATLTGKGTSESPLHAVVPVVNNVNFELELATKVGSNSYMEYTLNGSGLITNVDYWTDSGKGTKLFTKIVTYTGVNPTTITIKDEIANKTLTTTVAYSGSTITNVTKVIS